MNGITDGFVRNRQRHRLINRRVRDHDGFDLAQLDAIAARLDHVILASDKQVVAVLVESYPVASAVEFFLPADGEWVRDKTTPPTLPAARSSLA